MTLNFAKYKALKFALVLFLMCSAYVVTLFVVLPLSKLIHECVVNECVNQDFKIMNEKHKICSKRNNKNPCL